MWVKIGELAKRAGLTVRALRHYDQIGLLSPSGRSEGGFRLYSREDVVRLHRIQALKQLGFSLSEVRAFLEEPGASGVEIISNQLSVLEKQLQRAQILRDRLFRLREQLMRGEETGVGDWLTVLELMTLYEEHFSREELERLRANRAAGNLGPEWRLLIQAVQDAMDRGIRPEAPEVQDLARRWMRLVRDTTGNDASLAMKLRSVHQLRRPPSFHGDITPDMLSYMAESFAGVREAVFSKYLSSGELQTVRDRQTAHRSQWPALISEVRREMERGSGPGDPEVQALARRWGALIRESYSGGDPEFQEKVRLAFRSEPDLLLSVGLDSSLIAFIQEAMMQIEQGQGQEGEQSRAEGESPVIPKPSALRVAVFRAAHQLLDTPLVFQDPLALRILGADEEAALRSDPLRCNAPLLKGLRVSVVVRSRLAEDEWNRSKERGLNQYVILGAGLDTFAYRNPEQEGGRIFEVDLPETQRWKRACLHAASIGEPPWLSFVPTDFERSTLAEALEGAGFRADRPAFFSWLGVTMYLEEEAIYATLSYVASLPMGSGVVFDYAVDPSLLSPRELNAMESLRARVAEHGEPWKTHFIPEFLAGKLRSLGFAEVEDWGPEEINGRYLSNREDGMRKGGVSRMICARV
jgi:methyltransferase (TIGR00027 family)